MAFCFSGPLIRRAYELANLIAPRRKVTPNAMSANEGSFSPGSQSAAPPPPSSSSTPAPSSAPAPVAEQPSAPVPDTSAQPAVDAASKGAPTPEYPRTFEQAREKLHARRRELEEEGAAQPPASEGDESLSAKPETPDITEPKIEPLAPEVEAVPAEAAAAPAEGEEAADLEDLKTALTEDLLEQKYPRQLSKKVKADIAAREARRGQLEEAATVIGGDIGLGIAKAVMPILLTDCPFNEATHPAEAQAWWNENVDALFDQIILSENAGAGDLFKHASHRFVTTALYDEKEGPGFASNLISEEWGKQADGVTSYDLPFVDSILKAHKSWGVDADGKPIDVATLTALVKGLQHGAIDMNYVQGELADADEKPEPSPELLAAQEEITRLKTESEADKTAREATAAEQQRTRDGELALYKTQAKRDISSAIMQDVIPIAQSSGWAPSDGDKPERLGSKKTLGRMVAADINAVLMGDPASPNEDWKRAWDMVESYTAYDTNGKRTPRFKKVLEPLQIKAKAMFLRIQRDLASEFQFAAANTRNARLANKNGRNGEQPAAPPPVATVQQPRELKPTDPDYLERRQEAAREKLRLSREADGRRESVGHL